MKNIAVWAIVLGGLSGFITPYKATQAITSPIQISSQPGRDPAIDPPGPGWLLVGVANNDTVMWIHFPSVIKHGSIVQLWSIQSARLGGSLDEYGARSLRVFANYDCIKHRSQVISISTHSGVNGQGNLLRNTIISNKTLWLPLPPDTAGEKILQMACKP